MTMIEVPDLPEVVTRAQLIQACEVLGLPVDKLVELELTPDRVRGHLRFAAGQIEQHFEIRVK